MLFTAYSSADALSTLRMLSNHTDYAPETIFPGEGLTDEEYFLATYLDNQYSGYAYILKDEKSEVKAFASLAKWQEVSGLICWYVTSLFVENGSRTNELALHMVAKIQKAISSDSILYINVHPQAEAVNYFWRGNGYYLSIDKSRYVNSNGERLMAYTK